MRGPGVDSLGEPKGDLLLGALNGVRSVANVSSNIDGEVSTDGSGGGFRGLGGTKHDSASLDGTHALPDHAAHRATGHVVDEATEEALGGKVGVVGLKKLTSGGEKLHGLELEALLLEAGDDLTDETPLHAIRLDHDVSSKFVVLVMFNNTRKCGEGR